MRKPLWIGLGIAALAVYNAPALVAQGNPTCPTRPASSNDNSCASTSFVQRAASTLTRVISIAGTSGALTLSNRLSMVLQVLTFTPDIKVLGIDFVATGNGSTDDTVGIQAAIDYSSTNSVAVIIPTPSSSYIVCGALLKTGTTLIGYTWDGSLFKIKNGCNGVGIGSNSTNTNDVVLKNIRVNGNRANNSSGIALDITGWGTVLDNVAIDSAFQALHTKSGTGAITTGRPFIGSFRQISLTRLTDYAWKFEGPQDSHINDLTISDPCLGNGSAYGFWVLATMQINLVSIANSDSSGGITACNTGTRIVAPQTTWTNFTLESGGTAVFLQVGADATMMSAGRVYAPDGTYAVIVDSVANDLTIGVGGAADSGFPTYTGLLLGLSAPSFGNRIQLSGDGANRSIIEFGNDGGDNTIRLSGAIAAAAPCYLGVPLNTPNVGTDLISKVAGSADASCHFHQANP